MSDDTTHTDQSEWVAPREALASMAFSCICGGQWQTAMSLIAHIQVCEKAKTEIRLLAVCISVTGVVQDGE